MLAIFPRFSLVFQTFPSFPSFPLNRLRIAADHRQIAGRSQANAATGAVAVDFAHNDLPVSEGWMMEPGYPINDVRNIVKYLCNDYTARVLSTVYIISIYSIYNY